MCLLAASCRWEVERSARRAGRLVVGFFIFALRLKHSQQCTQSESERHAKYLVQ